MDGITAGFGRRTSLRRHVWSTGAGTSRAQSSRCHPTSGHLSGGAPRHLSPAGCLRRSLGAFASAVWSGTVGVVGGRAGDCHRHSLGPIRRRWPMVELSTFTTSALAFAPVESRILSSFCHLWCFEWPASLWARLCGVRGGRCNGRVVVGSQLHALVRAGDGTHPAGYIAFPSRFITVIPIPIAKPFSTICRLGCMHADPAGARTGHSLPEPRSRGRRSVSPLSLIQVLCH